MNKNRNESSESVGSSRTFRPWESFLVLFARQILMLPENRTLDAWLASLPELAGHKEKGQMIADRLQASNRT